MNNYGKTVLDIKFPTSRAPVHSNIFEVTMNYVLGDLDDMKTEVSYVDPSELRDLIRCLNWAHTEQLDEMDIFMVERDHAQEYEVFCKLFDYYPNENSSCMCYNLDSFSVVYYDHLGVSRECIIEWSK